MKGALFSTFTKRIDELFSDESVGELTEKLICLKVTASIDYCASKEALWGSVKTDSPSLIPFLNELMLALNEIETDNTAIMWLWMEHIRVRKLLAIAMAVERSKRGFSNEEPEYTDIPLCLVRIPITLQWCESEAFPKLVREFRSNVERVATSASFAKGYLDLFTKDRPAKPRK